jgi:hypothetical protein
MWRFARLGVICHPCVLEWTIVSYRFSLAFISAAVLRNLLREVKELRTQNGAPRENDRENEKSE